MGEDGGEVRGVLRAGGKEGRKLRMGGWDRVRGFILHSFVEPASRTTIRRENRALRRAMSVKSNEMQSTAYGRQKWNTRWGKRKMSSPHIQNIL